ncbi:unnamed protein product [Heterobilharzia americana]|nr:unnamed protein product [Heterobilharzia americana]
MTWLFDIVLPVLSYLQSVLLHLSMCRGRVFCLCAHPSSLLFPASHGLYSVPLFVVHTCAGSPSAQPSSSPPLVSMCQPRSIPFPLSSFFLTPLCRFPSTSLSMSSSFLPCKFLHECWLMSPFYIMND